MYYHFQGNHLELVYHQVPIKSDPICSDKKVIVLHAMINIIPYDMAHEVHVVTMQSSIYDGSLWFE